MKYHYVDENVKIIIYIPEKTQPRLLANATISLRTVRFGFYTTKKFQIWKSHNMNERLGEAINITPPKLQHFSFQNLTFLENAQDWIELERLIYSAYLKARSEKEKKEKAIEEDINPNEVPL